MTVYAVTGASGHLGRRAVQQLLARGVRPSDIVAVVRSRATVADRVARDVEVREADYSQPDTMRAALAAVDRLLLVSISEAGQRVVHHVNVIHAAKAVQVSRILYTSMLKTDVASNPFSADHLGQRARAPRERRRVHAATQWPVHGGLHRPFARILHQW